MRRGQGDLSPAVLPAHCPGPAVPRGDQNQGGVRGEQLRKSMPKPDGRHPSPRRDSSAGHCHPAGDPGQHPAAQHLRGPQALGCALPRLQGLPGGRAEGARHTRLQLRCSGDYPRHDPAYVGAGPDPGRGDGRRAVGPGARPALAGPAFQGHGQALHVPPVWEACNAHWPPAPGPGVRPPVPPRPPGPCHHWLPSGPNGVADQGRLHRHCDRGADHPLGAGSGGVRRRRRPLCTATILPGGRQQQGRHRCEDGAAPADQVWDQEQADGPRQLLPDTAQELLG
mmetsp:Transcript_125263/g.217112  ORF Transcript_125263/g.217112 Transcript_125263/m.217112 type:complete len:282 (+) Transcript_125263:3915-4760(+)